MVAGQRKIAEGQREVAEAWTCLEEACEEASIGQLPGLLKGVVRAEKPLE